MDVSGPEIFFGGFALLFPLIFVGIGLLGVTPPGPRGPGAGDG